MAWVHVWTFSKQKYRFSLSRSCQQHPYYYVQSAFWQLRYSLAYFLCPEQWQLQAPFSQLFLLEVQSQASVCLTQLPSFQCAVEGMGSIDPCVAGAQDVYGEKCPTRMSTMVALYNPG